MSTNPLLLAPSVIAKGDIDKAPGVYITQNGYADKPDPEVTHFSISAGRGGGLLNTNESEMLPAATKLLGVASTKYGPDEQIKNLLLLQQPENKIQAIKPRQELFDQFKIMTVVQWPNQKPANTTKIREFLAPAKWDTEYLDELKASLVFEGEDVYNLVHPCLPGELTVGYRTVRGLLTQLLRQFFESILSENERAIQQVYLAKYDLAQPWSAWAVVSAKQPKELKMLNEATSGTEPTSFPPLHYVTYKKESGMFKKWKRDEVSITTANLELRTPQLCVSSPAVDKAIHRQDDRFVFLTVTAYSEDEITVLAVEKSEVNQKPFSVDAKQTEKDMQTLMAGSLVNAAISLGLFKMFIGLPGKFFEKFFKGESIFTPSQLLLLIRLRAIQTAMEPGK